MQTTIEHRVRMHCLRGPDVMNRLPMHTTIERGHAMQCVKGPGGRRRPMPRRRGSGSDTHDSKSKLVFPILYICRHNYVDHICLVRFTSIHLARVGVQNESLLSGPCYVHDHKDDHPLQRPECIFVKAAMTGDLRGYTMPVVSGSHAYMVFLDVQTRTFSFKSINLDTFALSDLRPMISSYRYNSPDAFSLRGKLYYLGGLALLPGLNDPYGEVYDIKTNKWSPLTPVPGTSTKVLDRPSNIVTSLGDKEGKFMIYVSYPEVELHIYDAVENSWDSRPCPALEKVYMPYIIGRPLVNEDDGYVYWLGRPGRIYAFNWKDLQLYSGPLTGFTGCDMSLNEQDEPYIGITLHHVGAEFFCLFWCRDYKKGDNSYETELHFTFLRVIKNQSCDSLDVYIVGCYMDDSPGRSLVLLATRA